MYKKLYLLEILLFIAILFILIKMFMVKEPFTPGMRRIYRPYIRSTRIYTEKWYRKLHDQTKIFFVRNGLL